MAPPALDDDEDRWPEIVAPRSRPGRGRHRADFPEWRRQAEIREVEALHLEAIAGARRTIYLENQYFTSPVIAQALAARLAEPDGPEVVLVSTAARRAGSTSRPWTTPARGAAAAAAPPTCTAASAPGAR